MNVFDKISENLRAVRGNTLSWEACGPDGWVPIPNFLVRPYLRSRGLHAQQLREALRWLREAARPATVPQRREHYPWDHQATEAEWGIFYRLKLALAEAAAMAFLATDLPLHLGAHGLAAAYGHRYPVVPLGIWVRVQYFD